MRCAASQASSNTLADEKRDKGCPCSLKAKTEALLGLDHGVGTRDRPGQPRRKSSKQEPVINHPCAVLNEIRKEWSCHASPAWTPAIISKINRKPRDKHEEKSSPTIEYHKLLYNTIISESPLGNTTPPSVPSNDRRKTTKEEREPENKKNRGRGRRRQSEANPARAPVLLTIPPTRGTSSQHYDLQQAEGVLAVKTVPSVSWSGALSVLRTLPFPNPCSPTLSPPMGDLPPLVSNSLGSLSCLLELLS